MTLTGAGDAPPAPLPVRSRGRLWIVLGVVAVVGLAVAIGGGWWFVREVRVRNELIKTNRAAQIGDGVAARTSYFAAARIRPLKPEEARVWAEIVANTADASDAGLATFDGLVRDFPSESPMWLGRAMTRARRGDLDGAVEDLQQSLALDAMAMSSLQHCASLAFDRQDYRDALTLLELALTVDGDNEGSRTMRVNTLVVARRGEEALSVSEEYLRADPDDAEAIARTVNPLLLLARRDEAVARLRRALEIDPECAQALIVSVHLCRSLGDDAQADVLLERLRRVHPDFEESPAPR